MVLFELPQAKSNNNHAVGSTVASLVSSVTNFGTASGSGPLGLSRSPKITMVSPQDPQQHDHDSVRL